MKLESTFQKIYSWQLDEPKLNEKTDTFCKNTIDWLEQTFLTRLNDKNKGSIVLVMQRLHQDDLKRPTIVFGESQIDRSGPNMARNCINMVQNCPRKTQSDLRWSLTVPRSPEMVPRLPKIASRWSKTAPERPKLVPDWLLNGPSWCRMAPKLSKTNVCFFLLRTLFVCSCERKLVI